jgi:hypothetical protein
MSPTAVAGTAVVSSSNALSASGAGYVDVVVSVMVTSSRSGSSTSSKNGAITTPLRTRPTGAGLPHLGKRSPALLKLLTVLLGVLLLAAPGGATSIEINQGFVTAGQNFAGDFTETFGNFFGGGVEVFCGATPVGFSQTATAIAAGSISFDYATVLINGVPAFCSCPMTFLHVQFTFNEAHQVLEAVDRSIRALAEERRARPMHQPAAAVLVHPHTDVLGLAIEVLAQLVALEAQLFPSLEGRGRNPQPLDGIKSQVLYHLS